MDAGGVHQGTQPVNVHPKIFEACSDGSRIDTVTYEQLHTTIDLDGLFDILECKSVLSSWKDAERRDSKLRQAQQRGR